RALGIESHGFLTKRFALTSNGSTFAALMAEQAATRFVLCDAQGQPRLQSVIDPFVRDISLATDGRRYLALFTCLHGWVCASAYARMIEPDGSAGPPLDIDPPYTFDPSVTWSGSK